MKTTKIKLLAASLIASFIMFATTATYAQCQHQKQMESQQGQLQSAPEHTGPGCCGIKDITADQQKQMEAVHQKMVKEVLPIKNQIAEKKAHLVTVSTGDNVDMVAVNKTIDEIYALKAELAKKEEALKQEVRKLLTDEQKLQFDMKNAKGKGMKCGMGSQGKGCGMGPQGMKCGMGQQGMGCGMMGQQGMGCGMMGQQGMSCGMGQQVMKCGKEQGQGGAGCMNQGQEKSQGCCKDKAAAGSGTEKSGCPQQKNK